MAVKKSYLDKIFWTNKKVLITGVTGFKGSWMSLIMSNYKAKVYGLGLMTSNQNDLFNSLKLKKKIHFYNCDINNSLKFEKIIKRVKPDIIFHFAAQSLVIEGYLNPLNTFKTNIIGSINLLEAVSNIKKKMCLLITTTDKVYKNTNQKKAFIESDLISGGDPYSSSKAALEIVCEYYKLKFSKTKTILNIARSGNVIGGGDFAKFRLFPDIYRSIKKKRKLIIRSSNSVRPWQHVLEPLYGYIRLVEKTYNKEIKPGSFNFGPGRNQNLSVKNVLLNLKKIYSKIDYKMLTKNNFKESKYLSLDSSLINKKIKYKQVWSINKTINRTIGWYINFLNGKKSYDLCLNDIKEFEKDLLY